MEDVIRVSSLDPNFKYRVQKEPGGEGIMRCFACGTCTASCPVREIEEAYNPRKIIRMVLLGMKDEVLKEEFVWLCATCFTCSERCPQDVKITDLMSALRNIAVQEGYIHPAFTAQVSAIYTNGRLYEVGEFDNNKRKKLGLPEIPPTKEEVQLLMKETGVAKYAEGGEV